MALNVLPDAARPQYARPQHALTDVANVARIRDPSDDRERTPRVCIDYPPHRCLPAMRKKRPLGTRQSVSSLLFRTL